MSSRRFEYVLGDHAREAARLRAQARLWDPVSHALFDRIGIRRGWKVLEIGPGQGSLHMELRRRVGGTVDAVERSGAFAAQIEKLARRDGLGPSRIFFSDLIDADLPPATYDLIFARWVFLFLPDPAAHVKLLARALKPGGVLAIQDYHRDTFMLVPKPAEWDDFIAADRAFFASQGGNVSIGVHLPGMMEAARLRVVGIEQTTKEGHPGSPTWNWVTSYVMSVLDRLDHSPSFTRDRGASLKRRWLAAAGNPASLLIAPCVLDVIGRKPEGR
ncbi:MAG TPA: class I SAM-dependent methyltransferase [Vicinamibacterales bacterium]|nr:class I SAM-dependent methyltransferase [Vicinamibacterales bacterium]